MFEVGFTELLLIFALALLVLGPQKLPKLAQQVGRWVGRARAMARQFRDQLEEEANNLETKMNVDPDIDTSMETKREQASMTSAVTPAATPAATPHPTPPAAPAYQDVEEEFYPPDHHMHPANQAATNTGAVDPPPGDAPGSPEDGAAGEPSRQGELDLTNNPGTPKAP
jgi:sec-independent protein translocase protein TatB